MAILFDSLATIKPARFGRGILASMPGHRAPASLDDMAWAAAAFSEPDWDALAAEAAMCERYERGLAF